MGKMFYGVGPLRRFFSIRVANELGAGNPKLTKLSVKVVNASSLIISVILSVTVLVLRVPLSELFTSDNDVISAVSDLTPLLATSILLNGLQPILSGVAIGGGWQAAVAYVNLAMYYLVGLPIGCVLGFKTTLGVAGIWWGMIIGVGCQTVTLVVLTIRTNWELEVKRANERLKESTNEEHLDF